MSLLTFQQTHIGYQQGSRYHRVIDGLSETLRAGEVVALVGRNGCGKSSLLRTIAALQPATGGTILLDGKPIQDYSSSELAKLVGIVLTASPILYHTTVTRLVAYGRIPYTGLLGNLSATDIEKCLEAMQIVGITDLAFRTLDKLSDGERQKTYIAKAIAQGTRLLLLDEPTAFLDYPAKKDLMRLLQELAYRQGKAVIFSTHDLDMATEFCDRLWHIHDHTLSVCMPQEFDKSSL